MARAEEMGMAPNEVEMTAKELTMSRRGGSGYRGLHRPYYVGHSDGKAVRIVSKDKSFLKRNKIGKK